MPAIGTSTAIQSHPAESAQDVDERTAEGNDQEEDENLDAELDLRAGHGDGLLIPVRRLAKENAVGLRTRRAG